MRSTSSGPSASLPDRPAQPWIAERTGLEHSARNSTASLQRCNLQNTFLTSASRAPGNTSAISIGASPVVSPAVMVLLPSGVLYISAP
jgi:hypothetical protein